MSGFVYQNQLNLKDRDLDAKTLIFGSEILILGSSCSWCLLFYDVCNSTIPNEGFKN